ncbi:MAG: PIN domain-containing protein [Chloroflexota bacterium]
MPARFLDTNIFIRYFTRDDEAKAARALALLERVERGEKVVTSVMVAFKVVFTLERSYQLSKPRVHELLADLLSLQSPASW